MLCNLLKVQKYMFTAKTTNVLNRFDWSPDLFDSFKGNISWLYMIFTVIAPFDQLLW